MIQETGTDKHLLPFPQKCDGGQAENARPCGTGRILPLKTPRDLSIIRWYDLSIKPMDASYILIRQHDELGDCCSAASYENNMFWDVTIGSDDPIDEESIDAWAYMPFDSRVNNFGKIMD